MIKGVAVDQKSLRKVQEALEKKKKLATDRKNIKSSLRVGAEIALDESRRLVPVDTGALRDSLKIGVSGNSLLVKTNLPYATEQEFKNRSYLREPLKTKDSEMRGAIKDEYKKIVL